MYNLESDIDDSSMVWVKLPVQEHLDFSDKRPFQTYETRAAFLQVILRNLFLLGTFDRDLLHTWIRAKREKLGQMHADYIAEQVEQGAFVPLTEQLETWVDRLLKKIKRRKVRVGDSWVVPGEIYSRMIRMQQFPYFRDRKIYKEFSARPEEGTMERGAYVHILELTSMAQVSLERSFYFLSHSPMWVYPRRCGEMWAMTSETHCKTGFRRDTAYSVLGIDPFLFQFFQWMQCNVLGACDFQNAFRDIRVATVRDCLDPNRRELHHVTNLAKFHTNVLRIWNALLKDEESPFAPGFQNGVPDFVMEFFFARFLTPNDLVKHFIRKYGFRQMTPEDMDDVRQLHLKIAESASTILPCDDPTSNVHLAIESAKKAALHDNIELLRRLPTVMAFLRPPKVLMAMHRATTCWTHIGVSVKRIPCEMWMIALAFLLKHHIAKETGIPALSLCVTEEYAMDYCNFTRALLVTPDVVPYALDPEPKPLAPLPSQPRKRRRKQISK